MIDKGQITESELPSFLIECMVWNVPDSKFNYANWTSKTRAVLAALYNDTLEKEKCIDYAEVSDLKYLFRGGNSWTFESAHNSLNKIWKYLGYE